MPEHLTHTDIRRLLHLFTYVLDRENFYELPFTTDEWVIAMKWEEEQMKQS